MRIEWENMIVEVFPDHNYAPFSADNPHQYDHVYLSPEIRERSFQAVSKTGLRLRDATTEEGTVRHSAIICETGGLTSIESKSVLLAGEDLLICAGKMLYCLNLPSLGLKWKTQVDGAVCFSVHTFSDGLLTHGELQLTKLSLDGWRQWEFSARDIFVTNDQEKELRFEQGLVVVRDWSGYTYFLDAAGKVVRETKAD